MMETNVMESKAHAVTGRAVPDVDEVLARVDVAEDGGRACCYDCSLSSST